LVSGWEDLPLAVKPTDPFCGKSTDSVHSGEEPGHLLLSPLPSDRAFAGLFGSTTSGKIRIPSERAVLGSRD
jgi:hypothetical protein